MLSSFASRVFVSSSFMVQPSSIGADMSKLVRSTSAPDPVAGRWHGEVAPVASNLLLHLVEVAGHAPAAAAHSRSRSKPGDGSCPRCRTLTWVTASVMGEEQLGGITQVQVVADAS